MNYETVSLLLRWMELGVLLAILFRLSGTFELIANTQRELRRAIHHLGESRAAELGTNVSHEYTSVFPSLRFELAQGARPELSKLETQPF